MGAKPKPLISSTPRNLTPSVSTLSPVRRNSAANLSRVPKVAEVAPTGDEVLFGILRSWRHPWGFIVSPQSFEGDLFCHQGNFSNPPEGDLSGSQVSFQITQDQKGRPHAMNVQLLQSEHEETNAPDSELTAESTASNVQPRGGSTMVVDPGMQLVGIVRSWKDTWGFLVSPDRFEGDLFLHADDLPPGSRSVSPGTVVSCEVGLDRNGRPLARNVTAVHNASEWVGAETRLQGQLRSWKDQWGFVISPVHFPGDLFCHAQGLDPPLAPDTVQNGMDITFQVSLDKRGRCIAIGVQPFRVSTKRPLPTALEMDARVGKMSRIQA